MVCDSCIEAFLEEGIGDDFPIDQLPLDMGADIADHLCDKRETHGEIDCDCACNR